MSDVADLKQACLDISNAALELFDRFEEHGIEAAWAGDGALIVVRLFAAHTVIRAFLSGQVSRRMAALGISPERPDEIARRAGS